jgi:PAS domain S-box-containing protein
MQPNPGFDPMHPPASFADILITGELGRRQARPPEHEAENRALRVLARQMAGRPDDLLRAIARTALELCRAGTAGVSLLEKDAKGEEVFRWVAIAGTYEPHEGSAIPAQFSPASVCLASNAPQLFSRPVRRFSPFREIEPFVIEALAVPLPPESHPAGTIWVGTHEERRKFDAEDARLLSSLADFTAAGLEHFRITDVLRESEEKFRRLSESRLVSVAFFRPSGDIFDANDAFLDLIGYGRDDLASGMVHWDRLTPPEWQARTQQALGEYQSTGRIAPYEKEYYRRDGSRFWGLFGGARLEGKPEGVAFVLDITERKRTEQALLKQNERLRLLWEAAASLLSTDDPNAMLSTVVSKIGSHLGIDACLNYMVNEAGDGLQLEAAIGIAQQDVPRIARIGMGQSVCGRVARDRRAIMASHIAKSDDASLSVLKSLGLCAYACFPLLAEDRLLGTLSFASRRKNEFDHDEVDFLETICHYMTVAYDRLRLLGQLKESDRRKDEFLATLAHELRNPLAPLANAAQLLGLAGHQPAVVEQARATMERQLAQMVRLIDDLLDISRITYDSFGLRTETVELADVLNSAVESSRPLMVAAGHELKVSLPRERVMLRADMTRLAQVFMNLLNNASKYTEPGGHIELRAERDAEQAVVRVKDNGIGIAAEALPKLFEMFMQVDRSLERARGGLGIGLTLVKRLVEMHGGTVEAKSEGPGKGSEFIVRLPLEAGARASASLPEPQGAHAAPGEDPRRAHRILVADDNEDAAESLGMLLEMMGHEVRTAGDGVEAVSVAESFRPEVIFMDIGMPNMNGYDAARRIREQSWGNGVRIIALTGWGQSEEQRRSSEAGFDLHLVKPVQPAALAEVLKLQSHEKR